MVWLVFSGDRIRLIVWWLNDLASQLDFFKFIQHKIGKIFQNLFDWLDELQIKFKEPATDYEQTNIVCHRNKRIKSQEIFIQQIHQYYKDDLSHIFDILKGQYYQFLIITTKEKGMFVGGALYRISSIIG